MTYHRRPSFLAPILLIAAGAVALLVEIGKIHFFTLNSWYARWWPLLLIVIGSISFVEWWLDRGAGIRRRRHTGWFVALVVILAIAANVTTALRTGRCVRLTSSGGWTCIFGSSGAHRPAGEPIFPL